MDIEICKMTLEYLNFLDLNDFDNFWTPSILKEEILNDSSYYIIAKSGENILGFAGIKFLLDEAHVTNIVTRKDKRNLGIGSKLLEAIIQKANETSSLITLEVNEKNNIAIHLYEKYGFKKVGLRKKYYNNQFDALIMTKYFN